MTANSVILKMSLEKVSLIFWWIFSLKYISLSLQIDCPICPVMRYRKYLLLYMVTLIGISPFWRNLRFWSWIIFFSWYEFHARLNSHYEARSYKTQKKTKIKSILESWFEKEKKKPILASFAPVMGKKVSLTKNNIGTFEFSCSLLSWKTKTKKIGEKQKGNFSAYFPSFLHNFWQRLLRYPAAFNMSLVCGKVYGLSLSLSQIHKNSPYFHL